MIADNALVEGIYSQGFYIIDHFLPREHVASLQATALQLNKENQFHVAKIGNSTRAHANPDIRSDSIHWLDEHSANPAIMTYFAAMKSIATALNQQLFLGIVDIESHFALYQPGSYYQKHVDQFHNKQERRISCVYYLNNEWQLDFGGQLLLYDKEDNQLTSIMPTANRLICFNSDLPHEVQITTHPRLSIAGWMKTRALSMVT